MSSSSIDTSVYAYLSAYAYANFWVRPNQQLPIELPPGWNMLSTVQSSSATGFSAVFSNGFSATSFVNSSTNNIVISFQGTKFGSDFGLLASDGLSDAGLAIGLGSTQLEQAALYYEMFECRIYAYDLCSASR